MRKILAVALVIAVVIGIIWVMKPWEIPQETGVEERFQEGGETWTPPENLSGDLVAFHFASTFTYESSEGNQILENFEVDLPWPHYPSTYRPKGRSETQEGFVPAGVPDNRLEYDPEVYGFERPTVWSTGGNKCQIRTRCTLYYQDRLEAENGNPIQALGTRTRPPTIGFNFGDPFHQENILNKVTIYVDPDLRAGETVMIEGEFTVPKENAPRTTIEELGSAVGAKIIGPEEENAPLLGMLWSHPTIETWITVTAHIELEKWVGGKSATVEEYKETREMPGYIIDEM